MDAFSHNSGQVLATQGGLRRAVHRGILLGAGLIVGACSESRLSQAELPSGHDLGLEASTQMFRGVAEPDALPPAKRPARDGYALQRDELTREAESCRRRIEEARLTPTLPGAPGLETQRALVLARARAEPVVFLDTPEFQGEVSQGLKKQRLRIKKTHFPRDTMLGILRHFRGLYPELRHLLLRDGYFYTDDPAAARELTVRVGLEDLFREPRLELLRGSRRMSLERAQDGLYYYLDGPMQGQRARLLLFDRVWVRGEEPGPPLHVDVRGLASVVGFDRMQIDHLGESHITASLRFGSEWVPALLSREGTELGLECLLVEPDDAARIGRARDEAYRRAIAVAALRRAIVLQVRQGLPFDEPRREVGQQDGQLRPQWERAYLAGRESYRFNGDRYDVFDKHGNPLPPQVCVDFVTESLERASGMHYAKRERAPSKVLGGIDFDKILGDRRRQELALRSFASENPGSMRLHDYPMKSWVKYEDVGKFFRFLEREKDDLLAGDVVIIRGRAAWDRYAELHTHTFFIYETDPVTGMPVLLAGNSGKPRLVTWDGEMLRAPKRSIRHRIHLNSDWLYDHLLTHDLGGDGSLAPPLVVAED